MLEGQPFTLPGLPDATNPPGRIAQFMRMVDAFERDEIETAVDLLIAHLDVRDGDPDVEPNGDEADVSCLDFQPRDPLYRRAEYRDAAIALATEDDESDGDDQDEHRTEDGFVTHDADGPGCPIADAGGTDEDVMGDHAWIEWQSRGRHKVDAYGTEPQARGRYGHPLSEDVEDDDPREEDDDDACCAGEDVMVGDVALIGSEGTDDADKEAGSWPENMGRDAAGAAYADDDREDDTSVVRLRHAERVRTTRREFVPVRARNASGQAHFLRPMPVVVPFGRPIA